MQKSDVFLCTNNYYQKNKFRKQLHLLMRQKELNILRVNLTKRATDLLSENIDEID